MEKHIRVLGTLFIGLGILGLVGILAVLLIFGLGAAIVGNVAVHDPSLPQQITLVPLLFGIFIAVLILFTTVPSFVAGYGLLKRRTWARTLALVAGVVNLLSIPVGTAVGIYAIWVFMQEDTESYFRLAPQ